MQKNIIIENIELEDAYFFNTFPVKHYRLLKAISNILSLKVIVEVGAFTGMGAVSILQGLNNGELYTFDILPWNSFETHLKQENFNSGKVIQVLSDLSNEQEFQKHIEILDNSEIIFMDAPKDGVFNINS